MVVSGLDRAETCDVEDYLAVKVIQARYLVLGCEPCRFFRHGERGRKRTDAAERQESHCRSCDTRTHGLGSQPWIAKSSRKDGGALPSSGWLPPSARPRRRIGCLGRQEFELLTGLVDRLVDSGARAAALQNRLLSELEAE